MKGFIVIEHCDDFEQPLGLKKGHYLPMGGVLTWTDGTRAVFADRKEAREAIDRTDHYRRAFGFNDYPEKKFCKVVPVAMVGKGAA